MPSIIFAIGSHLRRISPGLLGSGRRVHSGRVTCAILIARGVRGWLAGEEVTQSPETNGPARSSSRD